MQFTMQSRRRAPPVFSSIDPWAACTRAGKGEMSCVTSARPFLLPPNGCPAGSRSISRPILLSSHRHWPFGSPCNRPVGFDSDPAVHGTRQRGARACGTAVRCLIMIRCYAWLRGCVIVTRVDHQSWCSTALSEQIRHPTSGSSDVTMLLM